MADVMTRPPIDSSGEFMGTTPREPISEQSVTIDTEAIVSKETRHFSGPKLCVKYYEQGQVATKEVMVPQYVLDNASRIAHPLPPSEIDLNRVELKDREIVRKIQDDRIAEHALAKKFAPVFARNYLALALNDTLKEMGDEAKNQVIRHLLEIIQGKTDEAK